MENLYAERPDVYDVLYAGKEYGGEVEFVVSQFDERAETDGNRVLVVGCGTGEHSKRLVERGFDVTGVDKYEAMVERARTKSDATFRVGSLPDLPVDGSFDLAFVPFTVVNHLDREAFVASVESLAGALVDGGVLVFDYTVLDEDDPTPNLRTHSTPDGEYARVWQVEPLDGVRYRWHSLVFTPDGEFFVDAHDLRDFDPAFVEGVLVANGFDVELHAGYGVGSSKKPVFVATL